MSYGPPTEAAASGCPLLSVPQAADEGVGIGAVAHLQTQVLLALLAPLHQLPWLPWQLPKKSSSLKPRPFPRSQVSQGQHPGRLRPHLAGSLCISQGETRVPVGLCGPLLGALGWICFGGRAGRSRFAARWRGGGALVLHSPHLGSAPPALYAAAGTAPPLLGGALASPPATPVGTTQCPDLPILKSAKRPTSLHLQSPFPAGPRLAFDGKAEGREP